MAIRHAKTVTVTDPTQADLDEQIALGNYPPGTLLADIALKSDWNDDHIGGADATAYDVTQASHGFSVGDVLYLVGAVYTKARADSATTADVVGMVYSVANANTFTLCLGGAVSGLSGLTAGVVYFLSDTTAGGLTATEPTTFSYVSKPLLIATSATTGFFINWRGVTIVESPPAGSTSFTLVEKDLGSSARTAGNFTIGGLSGLTIGKPVNIFQAVGGYTGKGTRADEAEMDNVAVKASVTAADTITAYWNADGYVKGNFKFNYLIGA